MPTGQVQANPSIRPKGPVTQKDVDRLIELFAKGTGVREAARITGLSQNQVTAAKKKHGLTSAPLDPKHDPTSGTEAFAALARRNRHDRYARLVEIDRLASGKVLSVLKGEMKHSTILRGIQGIEDRVELDFIPARDFRETMTAIVQGQLAMAKIEDKEDDQGLARGLSMLENFAEAAKALTGGTLPPPRDGLIQE